MYMLIFWGFKLCQLPEGKKVDIVSRVDGLRNAKDAVSHRDSAAKDRVALHVVGTRPVRNVAGVGA